MKRIRIGNDIKVVMPLSFSGDDASSILDIAEFHVYVKQGFGRMLTNAGRRASVIELTYTIDTTNSQLNALWPADKQQYEGQYDIIISATTASGSKALTDKAYFIELVGRCDREDADSVTEGNVQVVVDMDVLTLSFAGMSAYELAVSQGYTGTLEEWLEELGGKPDNVTIIKNEDGTLTAQTVVDKGISKAKLTDILSNLLDTCVVDLSVSETEERVDITATTSNDDTFDIHLPKATTSKAGVMSAEDKEKLDKAVVDGENDGSVEIQAYSASLINSNGKGFNVDDSGEINIAGNEVYLNGENITNIVTEIASKQDKLTAGDNITIKDNVISATGGGSGDTILERNATTASGAQRKNLDSTDTGFNATATGKNATSFGGTASGQYSFSEGSAANQAIGLNSHAEGASSKASGSQSHAEGEQTTAQGDNSHAEGYQATASGSYSHAEGMGTSSSGFRSHAEGYSTKSSGYQSHAEGTFAESSGHNSHAEGEITSSKGNSSHAEGSNTQATNYSEHAEGYYNASNNPDSATTWKGDGKHTQSSIGIGSSSSRKNAQEVMQNGDQYVYGIGGYDGTNATSDNSKPIQTMVNNVQPVVVTCVGSGEIGSMLQVQDCSLELAKSVGDTIKNGGKAYFQIKTDATSVNSLYVEITECGVGADGYSYYAFNEGKRYWWFYTTDDGAGSLDYVQVQKDATKTELETAILVVASTDLVQDSTAWANKLCIKVTESSASGFTIIPSGGDFPYGAIIIDDSTPVMYTSDDAITIDDTTTWADLKNTLTAGSKVTELTNIKKITELSQKVNTIETTVSAMPTTLNDNTIYTIDTAVSGDITVPAPTASELGIMVLFTAGAVDSITFSGSPKWINEVAGTLTSGSQYMLTILDGIYALNEIVEE